jgi:LmbE family N-acetylglucosaminyl deacetylase
MAAVTASSIGTGIGSAKARGAPRHIRLDGPSTPEARWQQRPCALKPPDLPLNEWLRPGNRLVAVAPHPDDEVLGMGGMLSMHAAQGGRCAIVAVTDGEASHADVAGVDPTGLAKRRRHESAEGLCHLRLQQAACFRLGLPDGQVAANEPRLVERLAALLRPDDTVLCTWRHDGHPDHDASARAAATACRRVGSRLFEVPIWMWHWAEPGDRRVPWERLRGVPLRCRTVHDKQLALSAHASQLSRRSAQLPAVLNDAMLARAGRAREYIFLP